MTKRAAIELAKQAKKIAKNPEVKLLLKELKHHFKTDKYPLNYHLLRFLSQTDEYVFDMLLYNNGYELVWDLKKYGMIAVVPKKKVK